MTYAVSHSKEYVPVFENKEIQELWERLHYEWFDWENPEYEPILSKNLHLFVDVIDVDYDKKLRLLAIYDSENNKFITDEDELNTVSMDLSLELKRDRFGKWLGDPEDEGVDYGHKLGQICPRCKTENRPMYDEQPDLAHYCDCTRGKWDDQVWD
jgi:hypothetical protein